MHIMELCLATTHLAEQFAFYRDTLGFTGQMQGDEASFVVGGSRLVWRAGALPAQASYHFACNIPGPQFAAARQWLQARLPLITDATGADAFHFATWNADAVYFCDPMGNIVEFIARHDLALRAAVPFTGAAVAGISEIGIVAADVPALVRTLQARAPLPIYGGAASDTFTPLGDAHGLFIVVKRGRAWFPTDRIPAAPLPVTITTASPTQPITWVFDEAGRLAQDGDR